MPAQITIFIPVKNGASFIGRAISSILSQNTQDIILLISDNCSTDDTQNIVNNFSKSDSRIIYHRQESDLGLVGNFSFCLKNIFTEFASFLSHDDFYRYDYTLESALKVLLKSSEIAAVYSNIAYVDRNDKIIFKRIFGYPKVMESEQIFRKSLIRTRNLYGIPILMRTERFKNYVYDQRLSYISDLELSYFSSINSYIYFLDDIHVAYRLHTNNNTWDLLKSSCEQFKILKNKYQINFNMFEKIEHLLYSQLTLLQKRMFMKWLSLREIVNKGICDTTRLK